MKIIIVVTCLLLIFTLQRRHLKRDEAEQQQVKMVLESNHFYSQTERETTEKISNLRKSQALVFMLKDKDGTTEAALRDNPITIHLSCSEQQASCTFNSIHNICSLRSVQQQEASVRIECKKTPCQASWKIVQPNTIQTDGMHNIDELVQINKQVNHAILIASCPDPNVPDFQKQLQLYTNSNYQTVSNEASVLYLFDNEEKGYYFITTEDPATKACANITIKHNPDQIQFNQKDALIMDYVLPTKTNTYQITKTPDTDFRVDAYYHHAKHMKLNEKSSIEVSLIGEKGSERTKLETISIPGKQSGSIDFSIVFKRPSDQFKTLTVDVTNKGEEVIIIDMDFKSDERQEVNLGESSYFFLRAGEKINYKLVAQPEQSQDSRLTYIFSSNETKFIPSLKKCKTKIGCQFTLEAKQEGEGYLYFGEGEKNNQTEQIVIDFEKSITRKLREGEVVLLKKNTQAKKTFQAVVNSPNVIIYAATKQKCPEISRQCHEKVLNSHNPFIFQPRASQDLYFLVEGLDNCEFTLTIIDEGTEYVELKDTKPFTYLFDDAERELKFQFKLDKKEDVNFNLIGPVNELNLIVLNGDRWNEDNRGQGQVSTDGYISFKKEDISTLNFVVKVEKREEFAKKYVHFTLLVSTKQANVRLQPGISHFQNIKADETRDFVFQFQPKKEILLNLYTHNVKTPLELELKLSTTDEYDKADGIMTYTLEAESEVVDLKEAASELCKDQMAENCELFVRLRNKMGVELDITLTLMMRDSIIELKDGIWNSFKQNQVARTSHFYFLPKHSNKSVTILYRADFIDLKIMYTIWKTDDKSISPTEWPFPTQIKSTPEDATSPLLMTRPTKLIHVQSQALKQCGQNCVILVTVFEDKNGPKSKFNHFIENRSFKIMGSNNFVEIPEKQRIDIILKKEEQKHLLVDLKYVMQKNALTFFTYFTMGDVFMSGNVYDEQNPRCPTQDEVGDFRFGRVETQISLATIKKKLEQNEMSEDKHPYICILARALNDTKFSIEFDSNDQILTQIFPDNSFVHQGKAKTAKIFQVDAVQEVRLKITRNSGFPFIDKALCKSSEDLESCLNSFKEKTEKGEQMANKMMVIQQEPCEKCILFLKFTSQQPSEINIHSQSKYAETQLQQKRALVDQVNKDELNKYIITANRNQELTINIQITHGDVNVTVNDFAGVSITKANEKGSNHVLITIPPKNQAANGTQASQGGVPLWGRIFFSAFAHSMLHSYHVEVRSQNSSSNAVYSIAYFCGAPETYLQDGLITTHALMPNKTTKFLYDNPSNNRIYLHISAATAEILNNIHIKILSLANPQDEETGVQMTPEKAKFSKKTPNPTTIMALPGNKFYQIQLDNQNNAFSIITLGINNQEIIYLPFNHEFPLQLNKGEFIYLVINSPFQAFMDILIKKCGESTLSISYTTDYQQFLKEEFQNQQEIDHDQLTAITHIKTKTHGAVYLKIKTSPDQVSVLTVKATLTFTKSKTEVATPGGKGLISYQLLDSRTAQLQFEPLVCPAINKNCQKDFSYSAISAEKIEGVYAQLVCPSIAFDLEDRQILEEGKSKPISSSNRKNDRIMFQETLRGDIDYVGIRAFNEKTGQIVYYKPVEIATFWGQVQKNSKGNGDIVGIVLVFLVVCCILLVYRRRRKREFSEYAPLNSVD